MRVLRVGWNTLTVIGAIALASISAAAQSTTGTVRGTVTQAKGRTPAIGAVVRIAGTRLGSLVDSLGNYQVDRVPAGQYTVIVSKLGYSADSTIIAVNAGAAVMHSVQLHASAAVL